MYTNLYYFVMKRTGRITISFNLKCFEEYSYFVINLIRKATSKIPNFIKLVKELVVEEELGLGIKLFVKFIENQFRTKFLLIFN